MTKHSLFRAYPLLLLGVLFTLSIPFAAVHAAQIPPQIFTYQGRLTNNGGTLLTGTYYFKFSIWTTSDITTGTQLWPAPADPTQVSATVTSGVFTVNIGDTANGYPYPLNLDFSANPSVYLQVRVSSSSGSGYETLSPRQQITSAAFAQIAGAVVGTTTPSVFGTTTPATNSFVTIAATSTNSIPLTIAGFASQLANLFQIQDATNANLVVVNNSGNVGVGTTTATRKFNVFDTNSYAQFRISQASNVYAEFYVLPTTGEVELSSTGGDFKWQNENLWVCSGVGCAQDDETPPTGKGNIIIENSFVFDNGFRFKQDSASTTMYDATDVPILQFDDGQ